MARRFARGRRSIVTARTWTGGIGVVKVDRGPVCRDVTILADIAGCKLGGRFTRGRRAVVAAEAGARDVGVIEMDCRPIRGDVAVFADIR